MGGLLSQLTRNRTSLLRLQISCTLTKGQIWLINRFFFRKPTIKEIIIILTMSKSSFSNSWPSSMARNCNSRSIDIMMWKKMKKGVERLYQQKFEMVPKFKTRLSVGVEIRKTRNIAKPSKYNLESL